MKLAVVGFDRLGKACAEPAREAADLEVARVA